MGCSSSTPTAADAARGRNTTQGSSSLLLHRHDPSGTATATTSRSANPLCGDSGGDSDAKCFNATGATDTNAVLHSLDHTLELPIPAVTEEEAHDVTKPMKRHRSASLVARDRSGYEAPQPSAVEHVAHIHRLGAIAGIHGLTPDPDQFEPPAVPASVVALKAEACRSWMRGVVNPTTAAASTSPP